MRGQLAQTGHCVCKYMQLEHEHVEAVERYWLCFALLLRSAVRRTSARSVVQRSVNQR